jgi:WD40 repeat protein
VEHPYAKDASIEVWEIATGSRLVSLPHEETVTGITFSPDGKYIATGSEDKIARIWEFATGNSIRSFFMMEIFVR